jgi:S-adenosylmethionine decarboxylase
MNKSWGYHLILDCNGCDAQAIRDSRLLEQWIKDLVARIDMKAHGDPLITYNGEPPYHSGYTVVQVITTSSIVAHFIDQPPSVYLDVFSCKPFDSGTVKNIMQEYFDIKTYKEYYLTRQA